MSSVRAELKISGFVQGVGFRYFACTSARNINLTGWVKNDPTGTVSCIVEGDRGAVDSFIADMKIGCRASLVSDVAVKYGEFTGEFNGFEIRR